MSKEEKADKTKADFAETGMQTDKKNKKEKEDKSKAENNRYNQTSAPFYIGSISNVRKSMQKEKQKQASQENMNQQAKSQALPKVRKSKMGNEESKMNDDKEQDIYEKFIKMQNLWDDLGVKPKFRESFVKFTEGLVDDDKDHFFTSETNSLEKIRDVLFKLSSEMEKRKQSIETLQAFDAILTKTFANGKEKLSDEIYKDICTTVKSIRIHSIKVVNNFVKVRQLTNFEITSGKFDINKLKKDYYYDPNYLSQMKFDLDFVKISALKSYFDISEDDFDTFLLNISYNEQSTSKNKKTIPIADDLFKAIKDAQYTIMQNLIFDDMTNANKEFLRNVMNDKSISGRTQTGKSMRSGNSFYTNRQMLSTMNKLRGTPVYNSMFVKSQNSQSRKIRIKARDKEESNYDQEMQGEQGKEEKKPEKKQKIKIEREEVKGMSKEDFLKKLEQLEQEKSDENKEEEDKDKEEIQRLIDEKRKEEEEKRQKSKKKNKKSYQKEDEEENMEEQEDIREEQDNKEEQGNKEEQEIKEEKKPVKESVKESAISSNAVEGEGMQNKEKNKSKNEIQDEIVEEKNESIQKSMDHIEDDIEMEKEKYKEQSIQKKEEPKKEEPKKKEYESETAQFIEDDFQESKKKESVKESIKQEVQPQKKEEVKDIIKESVKQEEKPQNKEEDNKEAKKPEENALQEKGNELVEKKDTPEEAGKIPANDLDKKEDQKDVKKEEKKEEEKEEDPYDEL